MSEDAKALVKECLDNREKYVDLLARLMSSGRLSLPEFVKSVAEYDAQIATKRNQIIAAIATVAGAVSAVAGAISAYIAYLGLMAHY